MATSGRRFVGFAVVCAAPREAAGLDDAIAIGVGKTAAAIGLMAALTRRTVDGVLLFGVAGGFPVRHRGDAPVCGPGRICVVGEDRFGDEGVATPQGFRDLAALGLGDVGPFALSPELAATAAAALDAPIVRGVTVSTCSGTDAASAAMAGRSGAAIETMEGAAVALVCRHLGLPLVQVRAVSNWTGDRDRGEWDLDTAVRRVHDAVRRLRSV